MSTEENPPPGFTAPTPEQIAKHFPAYENFSFIAQGGMGAVYRAVQASLDREIAIKILPSEIAQSNDFKKQFQAEARAMAKLNHPNLIAIYDFGSIDDFLFISMEFVNGKSLHYSCYDKKIEQTQAAAIVKGICNGLHHAHQSGIIHRDIKPANILLDQKAQPKIGDFGLACNIGETNEGAIFGTPGYAAPEVTANPDSIDERSDIYATGVILHQLLTGEMPTEPLIPATKLCKCHPAFNTIIRKAIHKNPQMRFKSAEQFSQELDKAISRFSSTPNISSTGQANANTPKQPKSLKKSTTPSNGTRSQPVKRPTPPAPRTPPPLAQIGTNYALIRNLVIIAVLSIACYSLWGLVQSKEKETAALELANKQENKRKEAERQQQQREKHEALQASLKKGHNQPKKQPSEFTISPETTQPTNTKPRKTLSSLSTALASGDRTTFPEDAIAHGDSHYLLVTKPMSWISALQHAEDNGAHLAVAKTSLDLARLAKLIPGDQTVWIGAGSTNRDKWHWVDGSPWELQPLATSRGNAVSLNRFAIPKPAASGRKYPFLIQWHNDGTNPGTLEKQLAKTLSTLTLSNPIYPPGTFSQGSRRYLLIPQSKGYQDALAFAQKYNATLATPSTLDEKNYLQNILPKCLAPQHSCWIANETLFSNSDDPSWKTTDDPTRYLYFLIEWSNDNPDAIVDLGATSQAHSETDTPTEQPDSGTPTTTTTAKEPDLQTPAPKELLSLQNLARIKLNEAVIKRNKETLESGNSFKFKAGAWLKELSKSELQAYQGGVSSLQKMIKPTGVMPSDKVPDNIPQELNRIVQTHLTKQSTLQAEFEQTLKSLHTAYLNKLQTISTELSSTNRTSELPHLQKETEAQPFPRKFFNNHTKDQQYSLLK